MQQFIYLRNDLKTFSDGRALNPEFALYADMLNKDVAGYSKLSALPDCVSNNDGMHLNVVAVHATGPW